MFSNHTERLDGCCCAADELVGGVVKDPDALSASLVQLVFRTVSKDLLTRFIVCFLLDSNITTVRWLAHTLLLHIYA